MSLSLDALKLSGLGPDVFPGTDAAGILKNSGVRRTYTNGIVKLDDAGGPYGEEQVHGMTLFGVDSVSTNGKPLNLSIEEIYETGTTRMELKRWPYGTSDVVAVASWTTGETPSFPASIELVEAGDSGIFGNVYLASAEPDDYIQVAVPFSATEAVASDSLGVLAKATLEGVTLAQTLNGRLSWRCIRTGGGLEFVVSNEGGDLAAGTVAVPDEFPVPVTLAAVADSGVTGSVLLDADPGTSPGASGALALRLPRGVGNDGHTNIAGDVGVGGTLSLGGGLVVDGDATVDGNVIVQELAGRDVNAPLTIAHAGRIVPDRRQGQQVRIQRMFAHGDETARVPENEYFMPLMAQSTLCALPENWWNVGNGISIKAVLAWTRDAGDELNLIVDLLENSNGLSLINLVHENVVDAYGETSGETFLDINLIVDRVEKEDENNGPEKLEVRGYYRMNGVRRLVPIIGEPWFGDYRFRILGAFTGAGEENGVSLKSLSITVSEPPVALE